MLHDYITYSNISLSVELNTFSMVTYFDEHFISYYDNKRKSDNYKVTMYVSEEDGISGSMPYFFNYVKPLDIVYTNKYHYIYKRTTPYSNTLWFFFYVCIPSILSEIIITILNIYYPDKHSLISYFKI